MYHSRVTAKKKFLGSEVKGVRILQRLLDDSRARSEIYRRGLERVIAHDDVNGTLTGHSDIARRTLAYGQRKPQHRKPKVVAKEPNED